MISIDEIIKTFTTESGFWNPLIWIVVIVLVCMIIGHRKLLRR